MQNSEKSYLKIGSAKDLEDRRERIVYRLLEIIPGSLVWLTFGSIVVGSIYIPVATITFVILFDLYWFLRTIYLTWHLRTSFKTLRAHARIDWTKKLDMLDLSGHPLGVRNWRTDVWHLVILPYYKESYEIIRNTCLMLLQASYSSKRLIVVLSGESRAGAEMEAKGKRIAEEFGSKFGKFLFTVHQDKSGELAGKGANETWLPYGQKTKS